MIFNDTTDIYIAELEADLGELCYTEEAENGFNDAEVQAFRAAAEVKTARQCIHDLPSAALLSMATKSITHTRLASTDSNAAAFNTVDTSDGVTSRDCEDKVRYAYFSESFDDVASDSNTDEGDHDKSPQALTNPNDSNNTSLSNEMDCVTDTDTDTVSSLGLDNHDDLDRAFDALIHQTAILTRDQSRTLEQRKKSQDIERKKRQDELELNRNARKVQRCARRYISRRRLFVNGKLQSLCRIVTKHWLGSALDQWVKLIQTRRKAGRVLLRFCRLCLRGYRKLVLRQKQMNAYVMMVIVDSGSRLFRVFFHTGSSFQVLHYKSSYLQCTWSRIILPWHNNPSEGLVYILKCRRRQYPTKIPSYLIRPHAIVCSSSPRINLYQEAHARMQLTKVQHSTMKRRALRKMLLNTVHKYNAAVCIQNAWRYFMAHRMVSAVRHHKFCIEAALLLQRVYRGYSTRKQLKCFNGSLHFKYIDNDIDCILCDDVTHLFDFGCQNDEQVASIWQPSKPGISIVCAHVQETITEVPVPAEQTHNSPMIDVNIDGARNGIMKQWRTSHRQIAKVRADSCHCCVVYVTDFVS